MREVVSLKASLSTIRIVAAGLCLTLAGCITTNQKVSQRSELDGFRGVTWGSPSSSVSGLTEATFALVSPNRNSGFGEETLDKARLLAGPNVSKIGYVKTYTRSDDKMEFGGVALRSVTYSFLDDQFMSAVLVYFTESAGPGLGRLPQNYNAENAINRYLKENFGSPTEAPNALLSIVLKEAPPKHEWLGNVTRIENKCANRAADYSPAMCVLIFSSTALDRELKRRLDGERAQRVSAQNAQAVALKKKQDEVRSKPDF